MVPSASLTSSVKSLKMTQKHFPREVSSEFERETAGQETCTSRKFGGVGVGWHCGEREKQERRAFELEVKMLACSAIVISRHCTVEGAEVSEKM